MTTKSPDEIIPEQVKGSKSDTHHSVTLASIEEAKELFDMAKNRLLDISNWDKLCGPVSGKFMLTDELGNEIKTLARIGDYIKIDVPGPGSETGDGFDWVQIETIEEGNSENDTETLAMKVRPAANPANNQANTAHFFKNDATSTFMVKRTGMVVTAEVHGRNELSNADQQRPLDSLRNTLMALSAMLGLSSSQWKLLVTGLVSLKKLR